MLLAALALITTYAPNPAMAVLQRTLGKRAIEFTLLEGPRGEEGVDRYTLEATNGKVTVTGSTPVAQCRGVYAYLREACHCQINWSGSNLKLPDKFPEYPKKTVDSPVVLHHYYNVCTFGYTTVWWDWKRWEKEIDWMAFHGINMPLAMNGQEKVWQTVFKQFGESDEAIKKHFAGPAFLPWHRMGNLNSHGGPLPQSWIDGQAELQKKILKRERELGMKPVVPGFSGFVPVDFDKVHPDVKLQSPVAWGGFDATKFVDARNPMFVRIGKAFVQAYTKEFGTDHYYLCDTFNEQDPQYPEATKLSDLSAAGKAVYESIKQGDPEGIWVMQGWLFYNSRKYWQEPEVEALVKNVPENKMIILDLATNEFQVYKEHASVRRTGWIYNTLHNYGQNTSLQGKLQSLADTAAAALADPKKGNLMGMGLTMEGIDQNPVVYELMTDAMWTSNRIDIDKWLDDYVKSRYGEETKEVKAAWQILLHEIYTNTDYWYHASWRMRPNPKGTTASPFNVDEVGKAVRLLLTASTKLKDNALYQRDLVDVTKTWLGGLAERDLGRLLASQGNDPALFNKNKGHFFALLQDIDRVMATRSEHRLSTWIADARAWGKGEAERNLMEMNARMQVTVWGGPELFDYANKEWAGLVDDFIAPRWEQYFGGKADLPKWELAWAHQTTPIKESKPEDPVAVAKQMAGRYS